MKKLLFTLMIMVLVASTSMARPYRPSRFDAKAPITNDQPVNKGPFIKTRQIPTEQPVDKGPFVVEERIRTDLPVDKGPFVKYTQFPEESQIYIHLENGRVLNRMTGEVFSLD